MWKYISYIHTTKRTKNHLEFYGNLFTFLDFIVSLGFRSKLFTCMSTSDIQFLVAQKPQFSETAMKLES